MKFLQDLVTFTAPYVFNQWREWDDHDKYPSRAASARLGRLTQHFECTPRFLLIGEAPGYQGCRYSGVPFTSERLILDGVIPRVYVPGNERITTRALPWSEPAASIVWSTLYTLNLAEHAVLWNAFAWHPHAPGNPHSNRTPTAEELTAGAHVLKGVIEHFHGVPVLAVGRQAERILEKLGIRPKAFLRHPSYGGAPKFRQGLFELFGHSACATHQHKAALMPHTQE